MKKVTILFGAGAAIPWQAPTTKIITNTIKECTDQTVDGIPLGNWINNIVSSAGNNAVANFETYVDFLESVYSYLKDVKTDIDQSHSILQINPEVLEGVKKIKFKNGSTFNSDYDKVVACFYSFLRNIQNKINKYLDNYIEVSNKQNQKLKTFIEHFIKIGYSVRSYTLNYDRSIPLIFESSNSKYEIFDGFDIQGHEAGNIDLFFCNKTRILNDTDCNSFYNLHGSFHWIFQDCEYKTTNSKFPFVLMSSKKYKYFPSAHVEEFLIDSNPNEKLLQTPIITGFKKIQRISFEPFNYFFHNFFRDVHQSEIIIIVGYSFSDPHINQLLRDALRRKVRIHNIAYRPSCKKFNSITNHWGQALKNDYSEYSKWYKDGEFFYWEYVDGFEDFLLSEEWFWIQPI